MKKNTKVPSSRRKFFSLGLLGGAALITPGAQAQGSESEAGETVQMLTPDGKLVEVPKSVIAKSERRDKARNEDILKWSNTANKSK